MRNVPLLSTALTLSLATACVQEEAAHPIAEALPTAEQVRIELPEAQASARLLAVGQIADYYVITRDTTRGLNAITGWVLLVVHTIVQFPATSVDGDVYTWGPWSDALDPAEYKLVVTDVGAGGYDWTLDGRDKTVVGSDFLTVISGNAEPAPALQGRGSFLIDFAAAEAVNPIDNDAERGTAEFTYDFAPGGDRVAAIAIHGEGFAAEESATFDYAYGRDADGGGDFRFTAAADLSDDGSATEQATIRSRWLADGAGRGDARVSGGDLGELNVEASECWDTTFRRVYYVDSADVVPTEGDAAACAFADADLPPF